MQHNGYYQALLH